VGAIQAEDRAAFRTGCTFAWIGGGLESEYSGLDGFREGWLDIYGALESARNQFEQVVPVRDKVLVLLSVYGDNDPGG
jgi:hypothetical protein